MSRILRRLPGAKTSPSIPIAMLAPKLHKMAGFESFFCSGMSWVSQHAMFACQSKPHLGRFWDDWLRSRYHILGVTTNQILVHPTKIHHNHILTNLS